MINLANSLEEGSFGLKLVDHIVELELKQAKINIVESEKRVGEPQSKYTGELLGWKFERAWYYWVASSDTNALPLLYATKMHETVIESMHNSKSKNYGDVIRVAGHFGCSHPREWAEWTIGDKSVISTDQEETLRAYIKIGNGTESGLSIDSFIFSDDPESIGAKAHIGNYRIDTQYGLDYFCDTLRLAFE